MVPRLRAKHCHSVTFGHVCCVRLPPRFAWLPPRASETQFQCAPEGYTWGWLDCSPGAWGRPSRLPACRRALRKERAIQQGRNDNEPPQNCVTHCLCFCFLVSGLDLFKKKTWNPLGCTLGRLAVGFGLFRCSGSAETFPTRRQRVYFRKLAPEWARLWQDASRSCLARFAPARARSKTRHSSDRQKALQGTGLSTGGRFSKERALNVKLKHGAQLHAQHTRDVHGGPWSVFFTRTLCASVFQAH